jgi:hypothetical protein
VDLTCDANQFRQSYVTEADGRLTVRRLAFGLYQVRVHAKGFAPDSRVIEIRSETPTGLAVKLAVAAVQTQVTVTQAGTLVDPHRTGTINRIGSDTIQHDLIEPPGRSVIELVNSQPGWLLESNGVLHPRGSEYQTQYVVDGVPLTDNRSPAFSPEIGADDVQSMSILTADFPAEYGRKLGGVIDVVTGRDPRPGLHGKLGASGGSFATAETNGSVQYSWKRNTVSVNGEGATTDRYLDPPVLENYTNGGTSGNFSAHYDRDLCSDDHLTLILRLGQSSFGVPNERVQQANGQRQDRSSEETLGIFSYQHVFSPNLLGDVHVMSRDNTAGLSSNAESIPIIAGQQRELREGYVKASIAVHRHIHEFKAGADADYGSIHEQFSDIITDPAQFDPGTPPTFSFRGHGIDREQSMYAQDLVRLGQFTISAGLRWDHYQLVVEQQALSPRLGISWYWPAADMVFHSSYDRIFQTPASENILLASSPLVTALNPQVLRLPVRPSLGNFWEAGFSKGFFHQLRVDVNSYHRGFNNLADDDLLLNTGVSFPIAFRKGTVYGAEAKVEVPRWGPVSGYLSYSYMAGFGYTPVTGGLFLGSDATGALDSAGRFPLTQDQRNTVSSRFRYQIVSRVWAAFGGSYGSGLPTEFDGSLQDAIEQYGEQIINRVNFTTGRIRPSLALNASAGVDLVEKRKMNVRLQGDVRNLNNRLNVINFAGLFSGTGIASPRSYALRLSTEF